MSKNIANFFAKKVWGSDVEKERHRRIRLSLAAYTYEVHNEIIMPDTDFDKLCLEINRGMDTGRPELDRFFREDFDPSTGMWIHKHPELDKLGAIYDKLYRKNTVRSKKTS